ncbi:Corticotropin-releasing factor receptor 2 [Halotydeus destructor]|nr:Corticotropin-releasing factor receptor 2 [Halotydeus destructor]
MVNETKSDHCPVTGCQATWDDLYCWPPAEAGHRVSISCSRILGAAFESNIRKLAGNTATAYRKCGEDGSWDWNSWTNYSECLSMLTRLEANSLAEPEPFSIYAILGHIVLICSFCSLSSLVAAITIFMSLRSLKCTRIRVHTNLCISLLIHCMGLIVISSQVVLGSSSSGLSPLYVRYDILCKIMKCIGLYSSMATINWMFIEGLVMHKSLYSFGNNKTVPFALYQLFAWGLPVVFIGTWITLQEVYQDTNLPGDYLKLKCWQGYGKSNFIFIITGPMMVFLIANTCFSFNIIRILVTKLRNSSTVATPRAIRATAFLIPLLGLEHLIFCINPSSLDPRLESTYVIVNAVIQSVQGLAVAILYCFVNKEVRHAIGMSWSRIRANSMTSVRSKITVSSVFSHHTALRDVNVTRSLLSQPKAPFTRIDSV